MQSAVIVIGLGVQVIVDVVNGVVKSHHDGARKNKVSKVFHVTTECSTYWAEVKLKTKTASLAADRIGHVLQQRQLFIHRCEDRITSPEIFSFRAPASGYFTWPR